jgi:hypothetical protein
VSTVAEAAGGAVAPAWLLDDDGAGDAVDVQAAMKTRAEAMAPARTRRGPRINP